MTATQFHDLAGDQPYLVPLTVEQYHRMIETGILEEGTAIELLDGFLVRKDRAKAGEDPMTVGVEHAWVLSHLPRELRNVEARGSHYRSQLPVTLLPANEPEPDGTIVRGAPDSYRGRHPMPADVPCAIEVSDSSLHRNHTRKMRIYAKAAIAQYIIVNLVDRVVEDYRQPMPDAARYATSRIYQSGETVPFLLSDGTAFAVPASRLLP